MKNNATLLLLLLLLTVTLNCGPTRMVLARALGHVVAHAHNGDSNRRCHDLALAIATWLKEWQRTPDASPIQRRMVLDHFQKVLRIKAGNTESAMQLACDLIEAKNVDEIQDVLKASNNLMNVIRDAVTSFNGLPSLQAYRRMDAGIRRLGYPQWPLTAASREDIQRYLDQLDDDVQHIPSLRRYVNEHKFKFSLLTDYYAGEQSLRQIADRLNINEVSFFVFRWLADQPITYAELVDETGWPLLESELRLNEALWRSGVAKKFVARRRH